MLESKFSLNEGIYFVLWAIQSSPYSSYRDFFFTSQPYYEITFEIVYQWARVRNRSCKRYLDIHT